jgi:deazaflavin-dependent oxidoreductase (nitroreductase family)
MAKTKRLPRFATAGNRIITFLLHRGVKMGRMTLLTVRGRKSGLPRTTPIALVEEDGQRWLIAAYGEVDWVRNLRAAGEATLTRGQHTEAITAVELPPEAAAPILKRSLAGAPAMIKKLYDVTPTAPLEDFEREVVHHPIFQINTAHAGQSEAKGFVSSERK